MLRPRLPQTRILAMSAAAGAEPFTCVSYPSSNASFWLSAEVSLSEMDKCQVGQGIDIVRVLFAEGVPANP